MTTGYILVDAPNVGQPQGTYPRRGGAKLSGTCIVHTSEGAWNAGVDSLTRLVRTRADYGCYHRACDWQDIALYYPWEWETWQDTETNNWAVGIAAACRTTDWATMPADIREGYYRNMARMAADFVAYMRDQYGIDVPLRRLSGAEARARKPGFAAHGDSGVSRSDPGRDFNWDLFFDYTAQALNGTHNPVQEDDMPITDDDLNRIADAVLRRKVQKDGGGEAMLLETVASYNAVHDWQVRAILDGVASIVKAAPGIDPADVQAALDKALGDVTITLAAKVGEHK